MNQVDVFILIVVGIPTILGLSSGFLKNLFAFGGIIAGLFVSTKYHEQIVGLIHEFSWYSGWMSFFSFIFVILIFYFLGIFIARKLSGLNFITSTVDKVAGALFGMLQGLVIASLLLLFVNSFNLIPENVLTGSLFYTYVADFAPGVFDFIAGFLPQTKPFFELMNFLKDK